MLDLILNRRTVHRYLAQPVPDEVIARALEAAHHAPCHRLTWPWRFTLVGPEARRGLIPIAVAEKERKAPMAPAQKEALGRAMTDPGALIVVTVVRDARPEVDAENRLATACAIQNLMLQASSEGYGTKWTTGGFTRSAATWALLGLDPAMEDILGGVWVGVPAEVPQITRPPWRDHVRQVG